MYISYILPVMKRKSPTPSLASQELAVLRLARERGMLLTRDVAALGVPTVVLTRLTRAG